MNLAIFDLDNTLLDGDSDVLWGQFLVMRGIVDQAYYSRENKRFYDEYNAGTLDIQEFLRFSLRPLADNDLDTLLELRRQYVDELVKPIIMPAARKLVDHHRDLGHTLLIITATNHFVTEPIAAELGIEHLIATDPEFINGQYTGNVAGIPSFREGKVARLEAWLKANGMNLAHSWFYSDSHNDLPLLEQVNHPVAVDADDTLTQHASQKGWPHISLKNADSNFDPAPLVNQ